MNIFLYCYIFFFGNTRLYKSSYKLALSNNNNNNDNNDTSYRKTDNIHISKNYIVNLINDFYENFDDSDELQFTDDELKFIDELVLNDGDDDDDEIAYDNINKANDIVNKNTISPIMLGINYAYPYENQENNNKILNDINKNLYLIKQKNILIDDKISNNIKLKIADEYLTRNTTKYINNIVNGGLYNDWLFNFE
jgi:hypothetical protein